MTAPDLDALEKLAESLATLDAEERDWPLVKINGRMIHVENAAKYASDGLTALIAELKEAFGLLETISKSAVEGHEKPGCDGWRAVERCRQVGNLSRAFLARNGKGEG